jgi:hypothetical protein
LSGCGGGGGSSSGDSGGSGGDSESTIIPDSTKLLDEKTTINDNLISIGQDGTLTFDHATPQLDSLKPKDVIVSGVTDETPNGLLRKVTDTYDYGGQFIVETEAANLEDAITKAQISVSGTLTNQDLQSVEPLVCDLTVNNIWPRGEMPGMAATMDFYFDDEDQFSVPTEGGPITISGAFDLPNPEWNLDIKIDEGHLKELSFTIIFKPKAWINVESTTTTSINQVWPIATTHWHPLTVWIGWFPIVILPQIDVFVGVDGTIQLKVYTDIEAGLTAEAGLAYDGTKWKPITTVSKEIYFENPTTEANADVKAWAGPRATFKLYGIAGPYGEIDVYGHFLADIAANPWWSLGWGAYCIVGIDLSMISSLENPQLPQIDLIPEDIIVDAGGPFNLSEIIFPPFTPDPDDSVPLNVVQTVPTKGSTSIPPSTSITIYFDDEVDPSTISDVAIKVKDSDGLQYYGTYNGELSSSGDTIMTFIPYIEFPNNELITVTLEYEGGIRDDGGNNLSSEYSFNFYTATSIDSPTDLGFENGDIGWLFNGDGSIIYELDSLSPTEGLAMAGISTGGVFGGVAASQTSSTLTSGPISVPNGATTLTFNYDFISSEFDEYVGTKFDDNFTVSVIGPLDSFTGVVTSVNMIGTEASIPISLTSPELQDSDHTDWNIFSVDIENFGSPLTITFTVTDVGDSLYTSVVLLDDIKLN